jgi:hypothetical protein
MTRFARRSEEREIRIRQMLEVKRAQHQLPIWCDAELTLSPHAPAR